MATGSRQVCRPIAAALSTAGAPLLSVLTSCLPALQLAEQRRAAQEEAESRELAHLAELEAAQDGALEVGAHCVTGVTFCGRASMLHCINRTPVGSLCDSKPARTCAVPQCEEHGRPASAHCSPVAGRRLPGSAAGGAGGAAGAARGGRNGAQVGWVAAVEEAMHLCGVSAISCLSAWPGFHNTGGLAVFWSHASCSRPIDLATPQLATSSTHDAFSSPVQGCAGGATG